MSRSTGEWRRGMPTEKQERVAGGYKAAAVMPCGRVKELQLHVVTCEQNTDGEAK